MARRRAVEVQIEGRDKTAAAYRSVVTRTDRWAVEMKRSTNPVELGFKSIVARASAIAPALVALGAVTAITSLAEESIEAAEALDKMAQRLGVSVEWLSTMAYAAQQSGADLNALELALKTVSKNASDTAKGTGEAKDSFAQLGIEVNDSSGHLKGADKILEEVADKLSLYQDGAQKSALAQRIFGESGAALIPLLNQGADGMERLRDQARAAGAEISKLTSKEAAEFLDRINELRTVATGLGNEMAKLVLPSLNKIVEAMILGARQGSLLKTAMFGVAQAFREIGVATGLIAAGAADRIQIEIAKLEETIPNLERELEGRKKRIDAVPESFRKNAKGQDAPAIQQELEKVAAIQSELIAKQERLNVLRARFLSLLNEGGTGGSAPEKPQLDATLSKDEDPAKEAEREAKAGAKAAADAIRDQQRKDRLLSNDLFSDAEGALGDIQKTRDAEERELERRQEFARRVLEEDELGKADEFGRIQIYQDRELALLEGHGAAKSAVEAKYDAQRAALRARMDHQEFQRKQAALGALAGLSEAFGIGGLKRSQQISSGLALISTFTGAAHALATPGLDPWTRFAIAAQTIVTGKGFVDQIRKAGAGSSSFSGAGIGSFSGSGGGYSPPVSTPSPVEPINQPTRGRVERLEINMVGDIYDLDAAALKIGEKIVKHANDGRLDIQTVVVNRR